MDRLDLIRIFVRVVETGNFSATARELGVGQPAISKRVAALEAELGTELIRRSSRNFTITEAGRRFYDSSVRLLEDYEAARSEAKKVQASPSGLLRVLASPTFCRLYVTPNLALFRDRYPDVAVDLITATPPTRMMEDGADVAIYGGELSDSSLVAKKIADAAVVTFATPEYLAAHGTPRQPSDLEHHVAIAFLEFGAIREWVFENASDRYVYQPRGFLRTNDSEQMRSAVLSHLGVANAPSWLFAKELAAGTVQPLLTGFAYPKPVFAMRPSGRRLAKKVEVFMGFVSEILAVELKLANERIAR